VTITYTVDTTPPTVTSIVPVSTPTNGTTASFTRHFSEPVNGVTSSQFSLNQGGGVTGAYITGISTADGTNTRTLTVNTGTGEGTISVDLWSPTPAINDLQGNALTDTFSGGTAVTIDKTGPRYCRSSRRPQSDQRRDRDLHRDIQRGHG